MSTHPSKKKKTGVDHSFRATWDVESAAAEAAALAAAEDTGGGGISGWIGLVVEGKDVAEVGKLAVAKEKGAVTLKHKTRGEVDGMAVGRKLLDVDRRVGRVVKLRPGVTRAGYTCKVCDVTLSDSAAYLAHMSGKRHAKTLGLSLRVRNLPAGEVIDHLDMLVAAKREARVARKVNPGRIQEAKAEAYSLEDAVAKAKIVVQEEREGRKRKRKRVARKRKVAKAGAVGDEDQAVVAAAQAREAMGLPLSFTASR